MTEPRTHLGRLALRRLRAGEALEDDAAAHAAACAECRSRLKALDDEQRRFEREISFDRFAAGVERAARGDRTRRRWAAPRLQAWMAAPVLAAAGIAMMISFAPHRAGRNRTKGGASITVRVRATDGAQRTAAVGAPEALARGERLRIGYQRGEQRDLRYLLALSIDDHGAVTPLYPPEGQSLRVDDSDALQYLPDSVEFTDARVERLVVVLSDEPIAVNAAVRAAAAAYDRARGDVLHLPPLELPGDQFERTFSLQTP